MAVSIGQLHEAMGSSSQCVFRISHGRELDKAEATELPGRMTNNETHTLHAAELGECTFDVGFGRLTRETINEKSPPALAGRARILGTWRRFNRSTRVHSREERTQGSTSMAPRVTWSGVCVTPKSPLGVRVP